MSLVIPLFATPISIFTLDISTKQQDKIEETLQNIDYGPTNQGGGAGISKDLFLFKNKNLKFIQNKILHCIHTYNENVFQYKKTKFEVTTSWATICNNQEESERHKHCNSMYSAVYYNKCSDAFSDMKRQLKLEMSTETMLVAPLEPNSNEIFPVPENRSNTYESAKFILNLFECIIILKIDSLVRSFKGLVFLSFGSKIFFPLKDPDIILIL